MADGETAPGDRLRRLELVTDAGLAQLDVDELLGELLERARDLLAADTAAVLLLNSSAQYLVATAARGIEEAESDRSGPVPARALVLWARPTTHSPACSPRRRWRSATVSTRRRW